MEFFKPSLRLAEDFAKQYDPQSKALIVFTSKKVPGFSGPIDVKLLRAAISERFGMFLGTLLGRGHTVGDTRLRLLERGRFTDNVELGLQDRLGLPAHKMAAGLLIYRLAVEFKKWATNTAGRTYFASDGYKIEDEIGGLILRWPQSVNDQVNKPTLPPLDKN